MVRLGARRWRMARVPEVGFAAVGARPELAPRRGQLILPKTLGAGKEELRERGVECRDLVQRAAEDGPKGVANNGFVGEIHDVERTGGVVQLARPDAEAMVAAQRLAEGGEILRQAGEGIHQRRGADTEPNPKSVSRLYPPDSRAAGPSPRIGSRAA